MREETLIKMISMLVSAKDKFAMACVDVNEQDRLGRTILHIAAQHGLTELIKLLLTPDSLGADLSIGDLINQRPVHYAIQFR